MQDADQDRVVFVDGTVDLGNVKAMRIERNTSKELVKPWPGIICAKRVESVPERDRSLARAGVAPFRLAGLKRTAEELVGDISVDLADIAAKVGQRILAKL